MKIDPIRELSFAAKASLVDLEEKKKCHAKTRCAGKSFSSALRERFVARNSSRPVKCRRENQVVDPRALLLRVEIHKAYPPLSFAARSDLLFAVYAIHRDLSALKSYDAYIRVYARGGLEN